MRAVPFAVVCLALAAQLHAAEIATGSMLGPRYKSDLFFVRKSSTQWEETYRASEYQRRARGKLILVDASQGLFEDEWLSEQPFDPAANTDALIAALDLYKKYGVLAVAVSLQGADPGYSAERNGIVRKSGALFGDKEGALISAFEPDGSLKPAWTARLGKLLQAADERGMFVKLTYFQPAQDEALDSPEAIVAGARNMTRWLVAGDHRNVIIDVAAGWDVEGEWDHLEFIPRNIANLIGVIREQFNGASFSLPIGAASGPSMMYPVSLAQVCDLVLLDERGLKPDLVARRFAQMSDYDRPLGVVVDAGKELTLSASTFDKSASWTYSPLQLTQYFPFAYTPNTEVAGSDDLGALLGQVASLVLKKSPQEADAGTE
ncbi:MAG: hypothetical protein O3A53_09120 [Acidobacteria bacterium]|nr:hypothetical protein [Acidobacteriota bacterium]MDA1234949.1 hypothetical protein [Acidobacteriota bacterium]